MFKTDNRKNNLYLQINELEKEGTEIVNKKITEGDYLPHINSSITKQNDKEYRNIIYYPFSTKEWFNSVYSYNKLHIKTLVNKDLLVNNLLKSYFNMFEDKTKESKRIIKRRRTRKNRLSANRIYVSKTEIKHTNLKLVIILYVYNKQKLLIERHMRKIINFLGFLKKKVINE